MSPLLFNAKPLPVSTVAIMKLKISLFTCSFLAFTSLLSLISSLLFSQYFQQEVNYKIDVTLDDIKHELNATESIEYINNSPDTLTEIYFHLWANAYKDNSTALVKQKIENGDTKLFFAADEERGYIDQIDFKVNGKPVKWIYDSLNIDICKLTLNEPLKSGDKILITTPFHVKIPSAEFSRLGHLGQAYFITQWYPKPSVYDQYGWHAMPYLDYGEFYSEWGSFEVNITLPMNYVVGATGELKNESEIKWMEEKFQKTKLITDFGIEMSFPPSSADSKTITFIQNNVHDFGWVADKRYHVLKSEVELPHSKNKVTSWALFTNKQTKWWTKATDYIDSALYYYSLWNGDYPYKNCTAVDGTITAGGGMEYPNITIIGEASNEFELEDVIVHEVGHNWFYGILGSNERDHGWMDEGINSFYEMRYVLTKYPGDFTKNDLAYILGATGEYLGSNKFDYKKGFYFEYLIPTRTNTDQPIEITSSEFTSFNYGVIMYRKTALIFNSLKAYLGDSLFDACMQQYFNDWKFKHPYPNDLRKIFETKTGKNLSWFFDDLLKTNKKIDYSITSIKSLKGENMLNPVAQSHGLTIKNRGDIAAPFSYSVLKNGGVISKKWVEGFSGEMKLQIACAHCDEIKIDSDLEIPEINRKNNSIRTSGLFRKMEKLKLKWLGEFEDENRTQLFFTPVVGWNNYNKTMAGVALYNKFIPNKKFEYLFMPMYSFEKKNLAGNGNINYTLYPSKGFLQNINFSVSASHYAVEDLSFLFSDGSSYVTDAYFTTVPVELTFNLRKQKLRSSIDKFIVLRYLNTWQDEFLYDVDPFRLQNTYLFYHQAIFKWDNKRTLDPYSFSVNLENGKEYMKGNFEFNYKFSYKKAGRGVDIRFFTGAFIFNNENERNYNYRMSGWRGNQDYLFDDIYLGRSETDGVLSQQTYLHDGGFKVYSPVGQSDEWISSLNIMVDFPGRLPLRFFTDIGTYSGASDAFTGSEAVMYDGGICLSLIKNVAEVYFPLFKSSDIKNALEVNDIKYKEQIRFVLNFKLMNPFRLRDSLFK